MSRGSLLRQLIIVFGAAAVLAAAAVAVAFATAAPIPAGGPLAGLVLSAVLVVAALLLGGGGLVWLDLRLLRPLRRVTGIPQAGRPHERRRGRAGRGGSDG